jgi:exodeoxyribonuclease VII large subunit
LSKPLTVTELTRELKTLVETEFRYVVFVGEISNFKRHAASGHCYFILKDESSQINATLWNSRFNSLKFKPEDGQKVLVTGRITLYEPRGTYQADVAEMQLFGKGDLQIAFEMLKEKLLKEGLFDEEHKRELPEFPMRVGIVTSETGAVIEDFKNVTRKRYPIVNLFLFSANVQGAGSKESICKAIRQANKPEYSLDIIVIARGGGSIEDLWTFNEEEVARAVYNSDVPTVSAIGHEVDFTICDFVADLRAPTPSAAAELIFPDKNELLERINKIDYNIKIYMRNKVRGLKETLVSLSNNYFFNKPLDVLNEYKMKTDEQYKLLDKLVKERISSFKQNLGYMDKIFFNLSPDQTLKRGFTYVLRDGKLITRKTGLNSDEKVKIRFYDGDVNAEVKKSD